MDFYIPKAKETKNVKKKILKEYVLPLRKTLQAQLKSHGAT